MRPKDRERALELEAVLDSFSSEKRALPGLRSAAARETFLEQIMESIHRVNYVAVIRKRKLSECRADPNDKLFDPLKAAILHQRKGHIEEAYWLTFLFVHFGKHARAGWRYVRDIYGRLGESDVWSWDNTSADPAGFRLWLHAHQEDLKRAGVPRGFGNHRKYQSLDAYRNNGTGDAVETYVNWISPPRTHEEFITQVYDDTKDPRQTFDCLYRSMNAVASFGRTARFDYLTMVGKLGLASIEPGSTYMGSATGPVSGARLLFGGSKTASLSPKNLDEWLVKLDDQLNVGMQVLEDALCNWQKSPNHFKPFRE